MTQSKPKMNLSEAFSRVEVTEEEAAHMLQGMAHQYSDTMPGLTTAIQLGAADLLGRSPAKESEPKEEESSFNPKPTTRASH